VEGLLIPDGRCLINADPAATRGGNKGKIICTINEQGAERTKKDVKGKPWCILKEYKEGGLSVESQVE